MQTATFNPADLTSIRERLARHLSSRLGPLSVAEGPERFRAGLDTYVYAMRLSGESLPPDWAGPLVLRVFPSMEQAAKAEREFVVQEFVSARGFPAPRPLLIDLTGEPLGLPFMIMERVPGAQAIQRFKNPLAIRGIISRMAALQARLHSLPTDGCPLPYDGPLVDRWLERPRALISKYRPPGLEEGLRWLGDHAPLVRDEEPVLTHNDFHPLNLIVDGERMTLLDWPGAELGDRHCDVARTLALFWLASDFERSFVGRTILRMLRGFIVRRYEREYGSHLPLDSERVRYWQALHSFEALTQITTMRQEGEAAIGARPGALAEVPAGLDAAFRRYFEERTGIA